MEAFKIRPYTKKELALCYFPDSLNPHSAVNTLMGWVNRCEPLRRELEAAGYRKTDKWLMPRHVELIIRYLGEP